MSDIRFAVIMLGALLVMPASHSPLAAPAQENLPATSTEAAKAPLLRVKLDCSVQGTPEDLPDDVYIRNVGSTVIPKGTRVDWSADGTTQKGVVVLPVDLTPGAGTFASGIVQGGLEPGHACRCTVASHPGPDLAKPVVISRVTPPSPLGCVVRGTPARYPDDLYILNNGKSPVSGGTTIHWSIPNTSHEGDYKLTAELAVGKAVTISDVVTGGMPVGVKCVVSLK